MNKENKWFYTSVALAFLLAITIGIVLQANLNFINYTGQTDNTSKEPKTTSSNNINAQIPSWLNNAQKHPKEKALGDPDAPVRIIEYLDIECPYCRQHSQRNLPTIVKNYVQNGTVYYKVKHFPLPERMHPNARPAANAAECAANQGKFWAFKTVAMRYQKRLAQDFYLDAGRAINIDDFDQFRRCVTKSKEADAVDSDFSDGRLRNVTGTPTIFINGEKFSGAVPTQQLERAIRKAANNSD